MPHSLSSGAKSLEKCQSCPGIVVSCKCLQDKLGKQDQQVKNMSQGGQETAMIMLMTHCIICHFYFFLNEKKKILFSFIKQRQFLAENSIIYFILVLLSNLLSHLKPCPILWFACVLLKLYHCYWLVECTVFDIYILRFLQLLQNVLVIHRWIWDTSYGKSTLPCFVFPADCYCFP